MAFDIGAVTAKIDADITGFKNGIRQAEHETGRLGNALSGLGNFIGTVGKQAAIMTGAVTAGLVLVGKQGLESAAQFEQYQIAFNTLLKDQKKAAEAIAQIQKDAAKTPFELAPLVAANQRLISAGVSAEDARTHIINLGNAVSATGGGNAELERLSVNLQQIKAVGKASALDIKQFAFAGINVYQLLADVTGKNVEQVKEMDISYDLLTKAFERASQKGGAFEGAMEAQGRTLNGLMSTLRDTINLGLKDILMNSGAFDLIRGAIEKLIPFLEAAVPKIVEFFQNIPKDPTVVAIFNFLRDAFEKLGAWISEHQAETLAFLKGLAIAFGALLIIGTITALIAALTNPLVLVAGAIALLATAWQTNFLGIRDITNSVVNEIINFWNTYLKPAIDSLVEYFRRNWDSISRIVTGAWTMIRGIVEVAWSIIYGILKLGLALLTGNFEGAWKAIVSIVEGGVRGFENIMNGALNFLRGIGGLILDALTKPFRDAWNTIQDVVNKIKDALDFTKRHSPSVVDIVNRGVGEVNKALNGLDFNTMLAPKVAGLAFSSATSGPNITQVTIDLGGAVIADEYSAERMGEIIGDNIIKKLQNNVRF